ncbi:MAG TPA: NAD(P)-binding domain-containing protein, partial [Verrucomicrobiae bacterium]|nr:NAD(P)-binding domain-containing protein [Verrucomicrobiae bacterium]
MRKAAGNGRKIADELRVKLDSRRALIGILGLGYVGLPLALEFSRRGFTVHGIDVDTRKVEALKRGRSYIQDVSSKVLKEALGAGRFTATSDFEIVRKLDAVIVCVPTPLRKTRDPDIS